VSASPIILDEVRNSYRLGWLGVWMLLLALVCMWCGSAFGHPSRPHSTPDPTHIRHFITPHQAFSNKWLAARQLRLRPLSSRQPVPLFLSERCFTAREESGESE